MLGWVVVRAVLKFFERSARPITPSAGAPLIPWDGPGIFVQVNHVFRISRKGSDHIMDVDQVEAMEPAIRSSEPGRHDVDEIPADPFPSGHTSRRWETARWVRRA